MRRGRALVAGLALALSGGCMALDTQMNPGYEGPEVYSGVRADLSMMHDALFGPSMRGPSLGGVFFGLFDMPFSFVVDTLLLPVTIPRELRRSDERTERLQVERDRPALASVKAGEAPVDGARRLFEACRQKLRRQDDAFADCYAVDARLVLAGAAPLLGADYKLVVREAFARHRYSGTVVDWRDPSFGAEGERVRVRATRRSTGEPPESALELAVAVGPDGGWRIVEETSVGMPEP